ncbi:phage tail protein [Mycobacterium gordonae]|nr:phage tail protein [Mycobacterium gordonae]
MAYPSNIDTWPLKLNAKQDGGAYVVEEVITITAGSYDGPLAHDNITVNSIRVYTGPTLTGTQITDYVVSIPADAPWRRNIRIFAGTSPVYVTYNTPGDQVDADDINAVQTSITATQTHVNTQLALKADSDDVYTKEQTDDRIEAIIGAAPSALDTLAELADALNNDPDFAATMTTALAGKVDKVSGKGLSTEDFTSAEKTKLSGIAAGANNYVHPATHPPAIIAQDASNRFMTDTERTKLAGIAAGANAYVHPNHTGDVTSTGDGVTAIAAGVIVDADVNSAAAIAWTKLSKAGSSLADLATRSAADLTSGTLPGARLPAISGDITIAAGTTTAAITAGAVVNTDINAAAAIDAVKIANGSVSNAEFQYLDGVTSAIQAQLDAKAPTASPALTGTPTAPTAAGGTNTSQLATTAFVQAAVSSAGGGDMLKSVYDANNDGKIDIGALPTASTSAAGIAQLNSATNSTSSTQAATPSAVKAAYDLAAGKLGPGLTWSQLMGV